VQPADFFPEGVEVIVPMLQDANQKVQMDAIQALSAYAHLGDSRVDQALREALRNPRHKVQHAAARALAVPCPGCQDVSPGQKQGFAKKR
jgi:hypothetical protein